MGFHFSGVIYSLKLLVSPSLALPHYTRANFNCLRIPLTFEGSPQNKIRAIILDKDDCFAYPQSLQVYPEYEDVFSRMKQTYPPPSLLIVSNSAGSSSDKGFKEAIQLEKNTGIPVLRHSTKKPGCYKQVLAYFQNHRDIDIKSPAEIAVIGDRLFSDVILANLMGAQAVWLKDGVTGKKMNILSLLERFYESFYTRLGFRAPNPQTKFPI